jgi:oligopeptide/dipeptide ABC transporter ATP-binding protein
LATGESLLSIRDLDIDTFLGERAGTDRAIDNVSFEIAKGERVGLVGESGAGKSLIAHAVLGLLRPTARITNGSIAYAGTELVGMSEARLGSIRGREIALIPQDPASALTPVVPIGAQITQAVRQHSTMSRAEARRFAIEKLSVVGIADPQRRMRAFPHELSGGMKQRVAIAIALACSPKLLIADEPTSGVDVTIQAQILDELTTLTRELHLAVLFISHDLRVISSMCDRTIVLYGGQVAAEGPTRLLLRDRLHPYLDALVSCSPTVERAVRPLPVVPGAPPSRPGQIDGCRFNPRCPRALQRCRETRPGGTDAFGDGKIFCWNPNPNGSA